MLAIRGATVYGIGMSLRTLREQAGLTQHDLAFILDVDPITISRWEKGRNEPNASMVKRLALALRVTGSEVLEAVIGAKQAS